MGRRAEVADILESLGLGAPTVSCAELAAALKVPSRTGDVARVLVKKATAVARRGSHVNTTERVAVAKVIVSQLPRSQPIIETVLARRDTPGYELQFTVFCYLEEVEHIDRHAIPWAISAVSSYLHHVPRETGRAAWMAGDLLGHHLAPSRACVSLKREATEARFVAGREGALHGIDMRLTMRSVSAMEHARLMATLELAARSDRSAMVRGYASFVLSRHRRSARTSTNGTRSSSRRPRRGRAGPMKR